MLGAHKETKRDADSGGKTWLACQQNLFSLLTKLGWPVNKTWWACQDEISTKSYQVDIGTEFTLSGDFPEALDITLIPQELKPVQIQDKWLENNCFDEDQWANHRLNILKELLRILCSFIVIGRRLDKFGSLRTQVAISDA